MFCVSVHVLAIGTAFPYIYVLLEAGTGCKSVSLNFWAAVHESPFGSCCPPQVLSLFIRYLFYLMQISSLLSFLNSRALLTRSR